MLTRVIFSSFEPEQPEPNLLNYKYSLTVKNFVSVFLSVFTIRNLIQLINLLIMFVSSMEGDPYNTSTYSYMLLIKYLGTLKVEGDHREKINQVLKSSKETNDYNYSS